MRITQKEWESVAKLWDDQEGNIALISDRLARLGVSANINGAGLKLAECSLEELKAVMEFETEWERRKRFIRNWLIDLHCKLTKK
jgi:hypothetical protein